MCAFVADMLRPRPIYWALLLLGSTLQGATVTFNGGVTYQTIEGFGANINRFFWNYPVNFHWLV